MGKLGRRGHSLYMADSLSLRFLLLLLLPAIGCVPAADGGDSPFGPVTILEDDEPLDGDDDPLEDPPDDDGSEFDWAMPPEFVPGTEITGTVTCGFVQAPFQLALRFNGERWMMTTGGNPQFLPGLMACLAPSPEVDLQWTDEPQLRFLMGQIDHILDPTEEEGVWFGEAIMLLADTPECGAALEANGLTDRVNLVLETETIPTT